MLGENPAEKVTTRKEKKGPCLRKGKEKRTGFASTQDIEKRLNKKKKKIERMSYLGGGENRPAGGRKKGARPPKANPVFQERMADKRNQVEKKTTLPKSALKEGRLRSAATCLAKKETRNTKRG